MMIKKVGDRKESSASRVIDYIQRALDYLQRADMPEKDRPVVFMGNCISEDIELCKLEIKSTQEQNTRVKGDKTYHMIISFSPEDHPKLTTELHKKIVADICDRLGFGEHQRVCAIHTDTENEHCHVIINKIHPTTFKIHSPYQDGPQMNIIAAELEQKYNLTIINHSNEKNEKINRQKYGILSFNQWVINEMKTSLKDIIQGGAGWEEVSEHLARHNLEVRKRGNGFVISDKDRPLFIKASSVTRDFKHLGPLPLDLDSPVPVDVKRYERVPVTGDNELWQKYTELKERNKLARTEIYGSFRALKDAVYQEARKQRLYVKHNKSLKGPAKKEHYKNIRDAVVARLAEAHTEKKSQLVKITSVGWLDFLMNEYNKNGNIEALNLLKLSKVFNPKFKNRVKGKRGDGKLFENVDNAGNSYVKVGKDKIYLVDDVLETQSDSLDVAARTISLAIEKYEQPLVVDGSAEFIKAIQLAAHIKGVEVSVAGQEGKRNDKSTQKQNEISI